MIASLFFLLSFAPIYSSSIPAQFTISSEDINESEKKITIKIIVPSKDFFYKDYLHFSVDHPRVKLSAWKTNIKPKTIYDPVFKETKQIYNKNFIVTLTATGHNYFDDIVTLHTMYYQRSEKKIKHFLWSFSFTQLQQKTIDNKDQLHIDNTTHDFGKKKARLLSTNYYVVKYLYPFKNVRIHELFLITILLLTILFCLHSGDYRTMEYLQKSDSVLNIFLSIIVHQLGLLCALFIIGCLCIGLIYYLPVSEMLYQNIFSAMYALSGCLLLKQQTKKLSLSHPVVEKIDKTTELSPSHFFSHGVKTGTVHALSIIPSLMLLFDEHKSIKIIPLWWIIVCISMGMVIRNLFIQKKCRSLFLQELIAIFSNLISFLFFNVAFYWLHVNNKPIVITVGLLISFIYFGCTFIKMSTKLEIPQFRSFASIIGSTFIVTSVYLMFITFQKFDLFFIQ